MLQNFFSRGGLFHPTKNYSNQYIKKIKTYKNKAIINVGSGGYNPIPGAINIDPFRTGINTVRAYGESLPFENESVDVAMCAAVLEHVKEPKKIVDEIYRVLKCGGEIYIEVPFMQPYHAAPDDYTRFTISGVKHLCKDFSEVSSGVIVGAGSAVAWLIVEYGQIFFSGTMKKIIRNLLKVVVSPLKYIDRFIIHKKDTCILASGFYFYGIKQQKSLF